MKLKIKALIVPSLKVSYVAVADPSIVTERDFPGETKGTVVHLAKVIKDQSMEFPDSVHFYYIVEMADGSTREFVNCPVVVINEPDEPA